MDPDSKIPFEIIRSRRKTIALEITRQLRVLVRAPFGMSNGDIQRFLAEKSWWLEKHRKLMEEKIERAKQQTALPKLTAEEICQLTGRARKLLPERAAYYAPIIGVGFGKITIRHQLSRWGSCSGSGNLSFNCLLMLAPPHVMDYVVVHELCHCKEPNHSPRFWNEVGRVLPDYTVPKKWLKDNGAALIQRLR